MPLLIDYKVHIIDYSVSLFAINHVLIDYMPL